MLIPLATQPGTLYGVSAGPGDPELITVKGLNCLQRSPLIAFPMGLGDKPGLAERIIAPWLLPHHQTLPLHFPYTRDEASLTAAWAWAAAQVLPYLRAGQDVCFVSEGDVSLYSTFSYLAHFVRAQEASVAIATIPGVCSPLAAAAVQNLPLTLQHQKLVILPALYSVAELETILEWADVLVLMKVSSVYAQIWPILKRRNLLENSYVVERATGPEQRVYGDLGDRPDLPLPYFAILVVNVRPLALLNGELNAELNAKLNAK